MGISYSIDVDPDTTAKAMLRDRPMSHKHAKEVAREIKGKTAGDAVEFLEGVIREEEVVPFRSHNSGVGHRSGIDGWDAGRYPAKVSEAYLDLLDNGIKNANEQGFDGESMRILHVAAHKVDEQMGQKPRAFGRASPWNTPVVDVELILEASEEVSE